MQNKRHFHKFYLSSSQRGKAWPRLLRKKRDWISKESKSL